MRLEFTLRFESFLWLIMPDLQEYLRSVAPTWSSGWRGSSFAHRLSSFDASDPYSLQNSFVNHLNDERLDHLSFALSNELRLPFADRFISDLQLNGTASTLRTYIRVDSEPYGRLGGHLILLNSMSVETERARVEGQSAPEWTRQAFRGGCGRLSPVFAVAHASDEWVERASVPRPPLPDRERLSWERDYLGPRYDRHLPGLFWANFYGPRYVDLIGRERLLTAPAPVVEEVGKGVLIRLGDDPRAWRTPEYEEVHARVLDHLGREYFFDPADPERPTVAPDWPPDPLGPRDPGPNVEIVKMMGEQTRIFVGDEEVLPTATTKPARKRRPRSR